MVQIKTLSGPDLPRVMQLCAKIFNPLLQGLDKNEDKGIWYKNYQQGGCILGAFAEDQLVGFIFFYEKDPGTKSIHCWMDGVDKDFRKQGIFTSLMQTSMDELKKRGYEYLTINTFPEKFPAMYSFLQTHGFTQYKEEEKDWSGTPTKKVLFRKKL